MPKQKRKATDVSQPGCNVTMAKLSLAPAEHSADLHRADGLTPRSSVDFTVVVIVSYNAGIQNTEVGREVQSWIGWHSQPCASDTHDAVVVMGTLNQDPSSGDVHPVAGNTESSSSSWPIPGVALFPSLPDGIESRPGESKPLFENPSSGDIYPVASFDPFWESVESGPGESIQSKVGAKFVENALLFHGRSCAKS